MLAELASVEGRPERAVRLYACASVLREAVGSHVVEPGWLDHENSLQHLRTALGEDAFAEAWERGRTLALDEALDYALEEYADPEPA